MNISRAKAQRREKLFFAVAVMMEGDVIVALLEDLKREAWTEKADVIESLMKQRADRWKQRRVYHSTQTFTNYD